MSKFVENNLTLGETIIYQTRISKWVLLPKIFFGIVLLPLFGIGLLFLAAAAMDYYSTELAVTNKRVIAKFGFVRRQTIELSLEWAKSIRVYQGVLGRIFNFGTVFISGGGDEVPVPSICRPLDFRLAVYNTQEEKSQPKSYPRASRSPSYANGRRFKPERIESSRRASRALPQPEQSANSECIELLTDEVHNHESQ